MTAGHAGLISAVPQNFANVLSRGPGIPGLYQLFKDDSICMTATTVTTIAGTRTWGGLWFRRAARW